MAVAACETIKFVVENSSPVIHHQIFNRIVMTVGREACKAESCCALLAFHPRIEARRQVRVSGIANPRQRGDRDRSPQVVLDRRGVQPLRNENTEIRRGAAAFDLADANDISGEEKSDPPDFDRALSGLDPSRPTVLLAHQRVQWNRLHRYWPVHIGFCFARNASTPILKSRLP
jgi:hypothetical protein